ncbi:hypothetical protein ES708_11723 [subsurface metagenome]
MINRIIAWIIPFLPERFVWIFSRKYIDSYRSSLEHEESAFSIDADQSYEDEIIQYLLDEDVEIETIVNEL